MNQGVDGDFFVHLAYAAASLSFLATWSYLLYQRYKVRAYLALMQSERKGR